ncbi:glycosyltransferase family 4 protein [Schleiferiaceae bacterium]|nr:glycosyltransferase family 4 protein [Schleiferiaceae bacterium]
MKLLFLTQYYPPETGAPQNRLHSLALNLIKVGFEIEVLTAMPNYPKMEIFPEYQGIKEVEETIDGVRVVRSSIYVTKDKGVAKRLMNYFSFMWTSMRSYKRLSEADYVLCESPPLFLGISALYLARKLKAKMIFNVSDLWPESAEELDIVSNKFFLGLAYKLEANLYKKSFLVTGQTQGIVADINRRFPKVSTMWLPNGIDKDVYSFEDIETDWLEEYGIQGKRLYIYAGIIGHAQGLDVIIKAKQWLMHNEPDIASDVEFVMIGDGPERDRLEVLDKELETKIVFIPNTPKQKVMRMIKNASGYIVPLKKLNLFLGAIPSKIFDPLALGIPVLLGVDGEARKLFIDQGNAGLYFEPENHIALAEQIIKLEESPELASKMGKSGQAYVERNFDRKNIALLFKDRVQKMASKS